jgi:hypothetical protein
VYSILGRDPNVHTGGITNFQTSGIAEYQFQPLYKFLQQHGVDTKNITQTDLALLWEKRLEAIKAASNGTYNIVVPHGTTSLPLE